LNHLPLLRVPWRVYATGTLFLSLNIRDILDIPIAATSFFGTRRSHSGHVRWVGSVGSHSHIFSDQKLLHSPSHVCWHSVKVSQPFVVVPPFQIYSADLLPETLQNLMGEMLVSQLNSVLKVTRDLQHLLEVWHNLSWSF
jgi:hypothetical protein